MKVFLMKMGYNYKKSSILCYMICENETFVFDIASEFLFIFVFLLSLFSAHKN